MFPWGRGASEIYSLVTFGYHVPIFKHSETALISGSRAEDAKPTSLT